MRRRRQFQKWQLIELIESCLNECAGFGPDVEVDGRLAHINQGLWHDNYRFYVSGKQLSAEQNEQEYILRILQRRYDWQQGDEPTLRLIRESKTLQALETTPFGHPIPKFVCLVKQADGDVIGLIETSLKGFTLERKRDEDTVKIVARVAANVHRLRVESFPHLSHTDSRQQHILERLSESAPHLATEFPIVGDVRRWVEDYAQTTEGISCVLHGDLLPQNLLQDFCSMDPKDADVAVVDWEMAAIGDPAYDLAIVSRGNRKVHGVANGLRRLHDYYAEAGGQQISTMDVRVHELLLIMHWLDEAYRDRKQGSVDGQGPDYYADRLRTLFQRTVSLPH